MAVARCRRRGCRDDGQQTLMRGLATAFPCVRPGLPRSASGHRQGSATVRDWLVGCEAEIEVFYLPGHSPELNPDEGVNGDLKQAVTAREPARSEAQLKRAAIGHMRRLSKRPDRVRSFFGHRTFRYAS